MVVGGLVLDIQAQPSTTADVRHGGSVPGTIRQTSGGVGRNICEALARLIPTQPLLVSVIGNDEAGRTLLSQWQGLGYVDVVGVVCVCCVWVLYTLVCNKNAHTLVVCAHRARHISTAQNLHPQTHTRNLHPQTHTHNRLSTRGIVGIPTATTATVTTIFNRAGEVAAQIADTASLETFLNTSLVLRFRNDIIKAPFLVLDGNLSPETLALVCQVASSSNVPVWYEPVSVPKAPRIAKVCGCECVWVLMVVVPHRLPPNPTPPTQCLRHTTFISPNVDELLAIADTLRLQQDLPVLPRPDLTPHTPWADALPLLAPSIDLVLEAGARYVVLTLGAQGAALACRHPTNHTTAVFHMDALPVNAVVNTSGAGDCLVAATVAALLGGVDPVEALAHGVAAGHVAVQTGGNVPGVLEWGVLQGLAKGVMETLHAL